MASEIASLTDAMVGTSCVYKALTARPVEEETGFATHSASVGTTSSTQNPRINYVRCSRPEPTSLVSCTYEMACYQGFENGS